MVARREDVLRQAMELSPEDRAALVKELATLIPPDTLSEIDQAWLDEVRRRYDAYQRGELKLIPGEQLFPELAS